MATTTDTFPPPFLTIPGVNNVRDIGGYPVVQSADGGPPRVVRRNVIFRGGDPGRAPAESVRKLHEAGIATVFDLRSKDGVMGSGGGEPVLQAFSKNRAEVGMERIWAPVLDDEKTSPQKVADRLIAYMQEGIDVWRSNFCRFASL